MPTQNQTSHVTVDTNYLCPVGRDIPQFIEASEASNFGGDDEEDGEDDEGDVGEEDDDGDGDETELGATIKVQPVEVKKKPWGQGYPFVDAKGNEKRNLHGWPRICSPEP
jgi:hypothetical protein